MTRVRLEIAIDELVFRGLTPAQARTAAGAFEARLAALASRGPALPPRAERLHRLPPIGTATSPQGLGDAVARAVWTGLTEGDAR